MKIHIHFCKCCQNFTRQSDIIDEALHVYFENMENIPPVKASPELKKRIKEQLQ